VPDRAAILAATTLALVPIDEMSAVRYVHSRSLRDGGYGWSTEEELDDYVAYINSPAYGDEIVQAIGGGRLLGAWIDRRLIGTAGWSPLVPGSPVARIRWCHVLALYGHMGIGRRLLAEVEAAAEAIGHTSLIARATPNATSFFESAGYGITSYGTRLVPPDRSVPVTFLRKNLRAPPAATLF
jgi:GNAT superfamily N-acetyltransferase